MQRGLFYSQQYERERQLACQALNPDVYDTNHFWNILGDYEIQQSHTTNSIYAALAEAKRLATRENRAYPTYKQLEYYINLYCRDKAGSVMGQLIASEGRLNRQRAAARRSQQRY